ncbi:cobalamin (vitamin B12) biosynthesis CbiX protein [Cyanobacterium stanieri PCC 7202]|uniref:Cobalamin (Vitamin B12) biosynthesis CbiX protein n=1 Tax=Cyanobacterium stanieri (strain ATCC 29140 / PCC 7202) TaxID=292563 RepID=K9YLW0_CYASC|nr:cobalamin (vitamin B12) biosynthesis CbiX protein [Cyanobacterium stanieri PCC 7202]
MNNDTGYLLVVHGSRNPQYKIYLDRLADLIREKLKTLGVNGYLDTAYLELSSQSLAQKITDFAHFCHRQSYKQIKILPLFLFSGTHVMDDIPEQGAIALKNIAYVGIDIKILPHLGSEGSLLGLLQEKYQKYPHHQRILIAHGTRLKEGQAEASLLAKNSSATLTFWSMNPFYDQVITNLVTLGAKKIVMLPYFLFPGKITRAIAFRIEEIKTEYNDLSLEIIDPLGATPELAHIIVKNLLEK